jgi:hypothetical protein
MSKHRTNRGREFNMQAFVNDKGEAVAVGNSNRNARGDLLGPGGKVIATSQQITSEVYNRKSTQASTTVKLNPMEQEISKKEIVGADGVPRWEITYADGSVEIQDKLETKIETRVDIDSRAGNKGDL